MFEGCAEEVPNEEVPLEIKVEDEAEDKSEDSLEFSDEEEYMSELPGLVGLYRRQDVRVRRRIIIVKSITAFFIFMTIPFRCASRHKRGMKPMPLPQQR